MTTEACWISYWSPATKPAGTILLTWDQLRSYWSPVISWGFIVHLLPAEALSPGRQRRTRIQLMNHMQPYVLLVDHLRPAEVCRIVAGPLAQQIPTAVRHQVRRVFPHNSWGYSDVLAYKIYRIHHNRRGHIQGWSKNIAFFVFYIYCMRGNTNNGDIYLSFFRNGTC